MDRNDLIAIARTALQNDQDADAAVIDAIIEHDMTDEDGDLLTDIDGYVDEIVAEAAESLR